MQLMYSGKKDISQIEEKIEENRLSFPAIPVIAAGVLIYGDNFTVMSRMLEFYRGKIDLVYIDPPFNTQNDFFISSEHTAHVSHSLKGKLAYSDKLDFTKYIEYIRERILLVHYLLSDEGTLYLHTDVKTGHYLKIIVDEIFGKDCFINEITRVKSNPKNFKRKAYGNQKDVIYIFVKQPARNIFNDLREQPLEEELLRLFPKVDEKGQSYTTVPCHAPGETINGLTGSQWKGMFPPPGRHWRCSPLELEELDKKGLIEWSCNNVPRIKKYAVNHIGKKMQDIWTDFKDPQNPVYPTEKNMHMLEQIIMQSSRPNSYVLDAFCGSGSFLAAAMRNGRHPIGIDCSETAIEVAKKRPELSRISFLTAC